VRGIYRTTFILQVVCTASATAHHSNAIFDQSAELTLRGTVSRYEWRNPHVYIYLQAANDDGQRVEWQLEGDPTPLMSRSGWTATSLQPSDAVTVRAHPEASGTQLHGLIVSLATRDGLYLTTRSGGRSAPRPAESIAGVWDALRGVQTRTYIYGELTPKGRAAQAEYAESMSPTSDCIPFPTPTNVSAPYLHELEILSDRILLRTEIFHVERTIYTDGRGHPENGERTNQGHSIGWWEGDTLVVDTTRFADNRDGNRNGIPGGAQKHTVERFRLSDDRRQLIVEYLIEDPEFMAEPMTGSTFWDYAPDRQLEPFACDSENARQFAFE
jgi:hypothetical protein